MIVKQAANALEIIELFARSKAPRTLSQISEALGLPKSSTFNLLETLAARGFIYELPARGGYYPTRRLLALGQAVADHDPFLDRIRPVLTWLQEQTGETIILSHRSGNDAVYIDVIESKSPVRYFAQIGDRRPVQVTSGGKAILSGYPADERARLLAGITFKKYRDGTLPDAAAVEADIKRSRARGWFENLSEYTPDVLGVGLPLVIAGERLALSVAGPNFRLLKRRAAVAGLIREAIDRIAAIYQKERAEPR